MKDKRSEKLFWIRETTEIQQSNPIYAQHWAGSCREDTIKIIWRETVNIGMRV